MIDRLKKALQDERCWTVYVHTNKSNNKRYVGITSRKVEYRWQSNGVGYKGQPFYNAIEKYGWDNFEHDIIASNLTCDEANEFEITLIRELDSHIKKNGYNTTFGGKGTKGCNTDRSMYTRENGTNVTKIICLNDMEIFNCALSACEKYNLHAPSLSKHLLGKKYKSTGKHSITGEKLIWAYYDEANGVEYYEQLREQKMNDLKVNKNSINKTKREARKVVCLNNLMIFDSIALANEYAGTKGVSQACRTLGTAGKDECGIPLKWMYQDEYYKLNYEKEVV